MKRAPGTARLGLVAFLGSAAAAGGCASVSPAPESACESEAGGLCTLLFAGAVVGSQPCAIAVTPTSTGGVQVVLDSTGSGYPQLTADLVLASEPLPGRIYSGADLHSASVTGQTSPAAVWLASSGLGNDVGAVALQVATFTSGSSPELHGSVTALLSGQVDAPGVLSVCAAF